MEIINQTPFTFACISGNLFFPKYSITLIVKGFFDLIIGAQAVPSEEQIFPTGDEFYPEDEDMQGGAMYSSDFAFFKPRADLLLVGKCHAPKGTKVAARQVKFQVDSKSKILNVFGNRYWKRGLLGSSSTDPEPFSEIDLRYENSFGGIGYKKNPVGKGINKIKDNSGNNLLPLPNILHPDDQIISPGSKLEPAGFGPLERMWEQRYSMLGTYKGNYLKKRWPWFPTDFDWGYFNAAPHDMQVEGYLKGDEEMYFENLHPEYLQLKTKLPGLRVRCFLNELERPDSDTTNFREIGMKLDTLWVDMDAEKLSLVWRGVADILTDEYDEIQHVFIISENVNDPPQTKDYYNDLFNEKLAEYEALWDVEPEEPDIDQVLARDDEGSDCAEVEQVIAEAEEKMKSSMAAAGFDPDNLPPQSQEDIEAEAKILEEIGIQKDKKEKPAITREIVIERIALKESFAGEDLTGLDLSELQMTDLDLQDVILTNANLQKSNLSKSNLTRANLADANLTGVNLSKTILKDADLTGTALIGAVLTGAVVEDAIFEKARLEGAILDEIAGKDADFADANLTGASLKKSDLAGANFSKCVLDNANFQGSNLREASVEGAVGMQVNMSETDLTELRASEGCNFTKGFFHKAEGLESIWESATLDEADFSYSSMEGADFTSASLKNAIFSCANMKFARFTKANLREARLGFMNLFQGSLEKADLSLTDFSGSNLYEVEFLESIIKETKFEFANLKMTKLSKR